MANNNEKSGRGFASMDEDKQREIASKGGKAAHQKGTAHEFDSAEAKEAGRKGGLARQGNTDTIDTPTDETTPESNLDTTNLGSDFDDLDNS